MSRPRQWRHHSPSRDVRWACWRSKLWRSRQICQSIIVRTWLRLRTTRIVWAAYFEDDKHYKKHANIELISNTVTRFWAEQIHSSLSLFKAGRKCSSRRDNVVVVCVQLSDAINFLHSSERMLHGNVCPNNVIITKRGVWKLAGLSFSQQLSRVSNAMSLIVSP